MKVMVLVKASKQSEAGEMPTPELLTEMGRFNEELSKAGFYLPPMGCILARRGAIFSAASRTVIDGPFAETKELVAGFWLWEVGSLAEAIDWSTCPNPMDDSEIEIRLVFEFHDFGPALTPELHKQENRLREQLEQPTISPDRLKPASTMLIAGINATYTFESHQTLTGPMAAICPAHRPGARPNWPRRCRRVLELSAGVAVRLSLRRRSGRWCQAARRLQPGPACCRALCRVRASRSCFDDSADDRRDLESLAARFRVLGARDTGASSATRRNSIHKPA